MPNSKSRQKIVHKDQEITFDDAVRFFEETEKPDAYCPMCGEGSWYVYICDKDGNIPILPFGNPHGIVSAHFRTALVSCKKCGFVRFHIMDRIADWLSKENAEAAEQPSEDPGEDKSNG